MNKLQNRILTLLSTKDQLYTQKQISVALNTSRQIVRYHTEILKKNGLITIKKLGTIINYSLTKKGCNLIGKKSLTPSETPLTNFRVRAHDLRFKCVITRRPVKWAERSSWRTVPLMNWTKKLREVHGYVIEVTTKHIIYRIDELFVDEPEDAVSEGYSIVRRINAILLSENKDLVLGEPFVDIVYFYGHHAIIGDPFAEWCKSKSVRVRYKDVVVDVSKGNSELQFINPAEGDEQARKYLRHVSKVCAGRIDTDTLETICSAVSKSRVSRQERRPVTWAALGRLYRAVDNITDYYANQV